MYEVSWEIELIRQCPIAFVFIASLAIFARFLGRVLEQNSAALAESGVGQESFEKAQQTYIDREETREQIALTTAIEVSKAAERQGTIMSTLIEIGGLQKVLVETQQGLFKNQERIIAAQGEASAINAELLKYLKSKNGS